MPRCPGPTSTSTSRPAPWPPRPRPRRRWGASCGGRACAIAGSTGGWPDRPGRAPAATDRPCGGSSPQTADRACGDAKRLHQQPAGMPAPRLGDRAHRSAAAGGMLRRGQAQERADAVAGEPVPVADLHGQAEPGQRSDAAQAAQPGHHRRPCRFRGHGQDRLVQPVPPRQRRQYGVVGLVEREPHARFVEGLRPHHFPCAAVQAVPS